MLRFSTPSLLRSHHSVSGFYHNSRIGSSLAYRRMLATTTTAVQPQNMIEKIVQRYAVDLPPNQTVRSGDF
ncbi:hypothetical protein BGZ98_000810, partial [Dissophora globulifera]